MTFLMESLYIYSNINFDYITKFSINFATLSSYMAYSVK